MKQLRSAILISTVITLTFLSCKDKASFTGGNSGNTSESTNEISELQDSIQKLKAEFVNIYSDFDNKRFLKQKEEKDKYVVDINLPKESLCGKADFSGIEEYQGNLGPSREFVQRHSRPVGAISIDNKQNSLNKYCSGTLISNDLFLTASHCIDKNTVNRYVAFNYQLDNQNNLRTIDYYKIIEIIEQGYVDDVDYAIIRLENNPGRIYGFTQLSNRTLDEGEELTIIQHPDGRPKEIEAGPFKRSFNRWMQYTDLDTEAGSSGSGVLDSNGMIVGVHTNGGCDAYSSDGANHGMNINTIEKFSTTVRNLLNSRTIQ